MSDDLRTKAAGVLYERAGQLAWTCARLLDEGKDAEARRHAAMAMETQGAALLMLGIADPWPTEVRLVGVES